MTTKLSWIGSLPTILNEKIDSVVSSELRSLAASICHSVGKNRSDKDDFCTFAQRDDEKRLSRAANATEASLQNRIAA